MSRPTRGATGRTFAMLVRNELRAYLRNRTSLFWVFLFPLLLFCTLGLALSGRSPAVSVHIEDKDDSVQSRRLVSRIQNGLPGREVGGARLVVGDSSASEFNLHILKGFAEHADSGARPMLRLEATAHAPAGATTAVAAAIRELTLEDALQQRNIAPVALELSHASPASSLNYRRFLFSGVLVLMLLSGGVLSLSLMLAAQREQGMLRLPAVWPVRPTTWLLAVVTTRALILLLAALGFLLIAHLVLDMRMMMDPARWLALIAVIVLASFQFLSIGYLIAARSTGSAGAELVGNSVYYPLLLLGDLTIPLRDLPWGLEGLLRWLPSSQAVSGLRSLLWGHERWDTPWSLYVYLVTGTAVCVLLAGRTFRFMPAGAAQ